MAKGSVFVCQQCSFETSKWLGKCPNCEAWASFVENLPDTSKRRAKSSVNIKTPQSLDKIPKQSTKRLKTGMSELDLVLGGGLIQGQVVLLAGEPGIGKSTLLIHLADKVENTVYISGEESMAQIKVRADRMNLDLKKSVFLEETDIDVIIASLEAFVSKSVIRALIIDSVQTMYTKDLTSVPGSVGQVREAAFRIIEFAKKNNVPTVLVGHVTKEGTVAGPATLAHMVDTVLWFEGDKVNRLRLLRSLKNRFASTEEVGIFQMVNQGLAGVSDLELLFLGSERPKDVAGSVISCIIEGTRPILIEIQCLVTPTKLAFPRRVVHGIDPKKVELLVAVLSRHARLNLADRDVFVNVVGGAKVKDPGVDLAIAFAMASSYKDKPVRDNTVVIGEVGLLGEIRQSSQEPRRVAQAKRQGITNVIASSAFKQVSRAIAESF